MAVQGDKDGAIKAYQAFLSANPFTQERPTVIEALANLGATAPTPGAAPMQMMAPPKL